MPNVRSTSWPASPKQRAPRSFFACWESPGSRILPPSRQRQDPQPGGGIAGDADVVIFDDDARAAPSRSRPRFNADHRSHTAHPRHLRQAGAHAGRKPRWSAQLKYLPRASSAWLSRLGGASAAGPGEQAADHGGSGRVFARTRAGGRRAGAAARAAPLRWRMKSPGRLHDAGKTTLKRAGAAVPASMRCSSRSTCWWRVAPDSHFGDTVGFIDRLPHARWRHFPLEEVADAIRCCTAAVRRFQSAGRSCGRRTLPILEGFNNDAITQTSAVGWIRIRPRHLGAAGGSAS